MIIYIYGSDTFRKDIQQLLKHSNIKFRLDDNGEIKELKTLDELKDAIDDNPNNIYLIDDDKIIKKNSLNQKIKFLQAKDAIEQEYLLDHGIGDISVNSIDELSKHIIKKLEATISEKESNEIQDSIVEIVEDAYEKNEEGEKEFFQLDDELSELLSQKDEEENETSEEIASAVEMIEEIESDSTKNNLSFDEDLDNIEESKNYKVEKVINQGVDMADEFSEFDTLNEADLLAALDGMDDMAPPSSKVSNNAPKVNSKPSENINLSGSNVDDIAKLISQLLNNKTLEITIKVKD